VNGTGKRGVDILREYNIQAANRKWERKVLLAVEGEHRYIGLADMGIQRLARESSPP
jgi:hypothetical protein